MLDWNYYDLGRLDAEEAAELRDLIAEFDPERGDRRDLARINTLLGTATRPSRWRRTLEDNRHAA